MSLEGHLKLYKSLAKHKVRYLLIGGTAVVIYGVPRSTLDIDILIEPDMKNAQRLYNALDEAGLGTVSLTTPGKIVRNEISVFNDFIRLDVLTKAKAIDFEKAWLRRTIKKIKGVPVVLASITDIIKCKKAVGRAVDDEDVKILKKMQKNLGSSKRQ